MIVKSKKLDAVCYEIRGSISQEANRLLANGEKILKLNSGNLGAFELYAANEIINNVKNNLNNSQAYIDHKGLLSARIAIAQECKNIGITGVNVEDIYIGNGVSELIQLALNALVNSGDEILIPAPDYPLWTASVTLVGGNAIHYRCNEDDDWLPDLDDIESKISDKSKGLVVINPNNPTGAVYPLDYLEKLIEIARRHQLILFTDEIYQKIIYDDAIAYPLASLADDLLIITFNGLSKNFNLCGFRTGWMILSGAKDSAKDYIDGIDTLSTMRLCSNVPTQFAIEPALSLSKENSLIKPKGRLYEQRNTCYQAILKIPGVSCVKPSSAFYLFPKLDPKLYKVQDDQLLVLELLKEKHVLVVQGSGFNVNDKQHFRIVFLPKCDELIEAVEKIGHFLQSYY